MNIKIRLTVMNFLQFAVWGAYLTSMGAFLAGAGLAENIGWFYAVQGFVSLFMPAVIGIVADRWIPAQKMLGICHFLAAAGMAAAAYFGSLPHISLAAVFGFYTFSVAFYMPTLALSNTAAFTILKNNGMDTVKDFPPIRVFGTVGFIATMWFVNCATWHDGNFGFTIGEDLTKFQLTHFQFLVSGVLGVILFAYCMTLPQCKLVKTVGQTLAQQLGLDAFKLFKQKKMALFFIFSMLLGMSLQVTNGFATPFLTSFKGSDVAEIANSFAANNATMLVSLSQVAEALCILLIPFFLRRFGIKIVMLIAMFAWVFRFGFFGLGSPEFPGVLLFILSCVVYGVAFDFFNVSGGLFVDKECDPSVRASGQGLFMLMTNGLGATVGTLAAGEIVNHFCAWNENGYLMSINPGGWQNAWFIFAGFALVVAIAFMFLFKYKHEPEAK